MATQVQGSTTYTYIYDWTGKRQSRQSSSGSKYWYLFNGDQLVGEFGKSTSSGTVSPTVAYTWGADGLAIERSISNNNSLYYHFGPQGETRQLSDSTGAVANTYLYNAYGATIASTGAEYNRHRYGGKVGYFTDGPSSSVLILATQRWYNPEIRRWLSRDPIEYRGGENLMEYVGGNPVRFVDPRGLDQVKNSSGEPIIISGNGGDGHGSGAQIYGIIPPGQRWGGKDKPVPGYRRPETPFTGVGPLIWPIRPSGGIQDIDFYYCEEKGSVKISGDSDGPVTTLNRDHAGHLYILSRDGELRAIYRYLQR